MALDRIRRHRPELLAPAGDENSLRAAVANGADAVYFGLQDFNARRRAENFTLESLPATIRYLHHHNVRGYVAFNTLIFPDEIRKATEHIMAVAVAGTDAVIVQDLGLARIIHEMIPSLPLHASTQMTQTHAAGIELLRSWGIRRVILARELALTEIEQIARETSAELEVFVHGALCISCSGQCLASLSLFNRSANRGVCAQACRLPYQLVMDGRPLTESDLVYPLSPRDLAAYTLAGRLTRLGITSFKIEGRLKNAEYVAATTHLYRCAIDAAADGKDFSPSDRQKLDVAQNFSRGFSQGFLGGNHHLALVDGRSPKNRGIAVGIVVGKTARGVIVAIDRIDGMNSKGSVAIRLKPGDGIVFDRGPGDQEPQGGRIYSVRPIELPGRPAGRGLQPPHETLELTFGRDDVDLRAIAMDSRVWKTDDPAVRRRLECSFSRDVIFHRVPLHLRAVILPDNRLSIELADPFGHRAEMTTVEPLKVTDRYPLTADLLREQFARLGDTPFEMGKVDLIGLKGHSDSFALLAPKSILNNLRRQLVKELIRQRDTTAGHSIVTEWASSLSARSILPGSGQSVVNGVPQASGTNEETVCHHLLAVLIRQVEQFEAVLNWRSPVPSVALDVIYCDYRDIAHYRVAVTGKQPAVWIALASPRICKPGEEHLLRMIAELRPDAVLVRNLTALSFFRTHLPGVMLVGDTSLNVTNEFTARELKAAGLSRLTPGYDLNTTQVDDLCRRAPEVSFELMAFSHAPLFHTAHCIAAACLKSGDHCDHCRQPCRKHLFALRDRQGVQHPLLFDAAGRNTVFNSRSDSIILRPRGRLNLKSGKSRHLEGASRSADGRGDSPAVPSLRIDQGQLPRYWRVEFVRESEQEISSLLNNCAATLSHQ